MRHERSLVERARQLALVAHANQAYMANEVGFTPYSVHLEDVVNTLISFCFGDCQHILAAGWLHDVLEDTHITREMLLRVVDSCTVDAVWAVTGEGNSRKERNESIYAKLQHWRSDAISVKLADRIANATAAYRKQNRKLFAMYSTEYPEFCAKLRARHEKDARFLAMWKRLDDIFKCPYLAEVRQ